MPHRCAFLTMTDLNDFVTDDELAVEPLARRGWQVEFVPWRDAADWNRFDAVVVRSPWDYQSFPAEFEQTLQTIDRSRARLANELKTMRWNLNKRYLRDLESRGVSIPPTLWRRGLAANELPDRFAELASAEIVIKPVIGAGAKDTFWLDRSQARQQATELERVYADREAMIQPFLPEVVNEGEFSLILFNGKLSHTILKTPKQHDFRVQEEHGSTIVAVDAEPALIAAADKAMESMKSRSQNRRGLAHFAESSEQNVPVPLSADGSGIGSKRTPLYARVDFVRHEGQFLLMELELIEPSLYLRMDDGAAERFAEAFVDWMGRK